MNIEKFLNKQNIVNIGDVVFDMEILRKLIIETENDRDVTGIKYNTTTDIYISNNMIELRKLRTYADIITNIKLIPDIDYEYIFKDDVIICETIPICIYASDFGPCIKFKENYGDKYNKIKISFTGYTLDNKIRKFVSLNKIEDNLKTLYEIDNISKPLKF